MRVLDLCLSCLLPWQEATKIILLSFLWTPFKWRSEHWKEEKSIHLFMNLSETYLRLISLFEMTDNLSKWQTVKFDKHWIWSLRPCPMWSANRKIGSVSSLKLMEIMERMIHSLLITISQSISQWATIIRSILCILISSSNINISLFAPPSSGMNLLDELTCHNTLKKAGKDDRMYFFYSWHGES